MQEKINLFTKLLDSVHCVGTVDEAVSAVLKKLLFCPFCDEYFIESASLLDHIKKDHPDRLSSKTIKVEMHEVEDDAETVYICPHCRFAVDNNSSSPTSAIINHIENHTGSIDPTARISFQISRDKELIQTYINDKMEIDLFCCSVCTDIFGDAESLLRHLYYKHSDADSKNIPYETINLIRDCAKDFPTQKKAKVKYKLKYPF